MANNYIFLPMEAQIPLPSGAATAANQVLELTKLTSIDGKLTAPLSVTGPLTDTQLRLTPVPVSLTSTTITGSVAVTGSFYQATQPISAVSLPLPSGAATDALQTAGNASLVSIDSKLTSPLTVTGPLTDTQLRAAAVPVSLTSTTITGSVAVTGPLTDTQLRATAVPVSGTVTATGPLTDTQLRATAVPVSLTSTTITGNVTAVQATGSNLHTVIDSGTVTTVSAVTAITNALPAGSNVIGHVIADTGSTTAVTGNVTVVQGTGTNLHTVIDSGTVTAVTAITNALPSGSNVIGHVINDSGSTTAVTGNVTVVQPTGANLHTVIDSGTLTTVSTVTAVTAITNALPAGSNVIGHVIVDSGTITANAGSFATAANTRVSVDNSATVQLLAGNANRKYAYIMNMTGNAMYLKLGASAVIGQGILLSNNGMYEITGENLWTGTVNAISSSPTASSLDVFEGTP